MKKARTLIDDLAASIKTNSANYDRILHPIGSPSKEEYDELIYAAYLQSDSNIEMFESTMFSATDEKFQLNNELKDIEEVFRLCDVGTQAEMEFIEKLDILYGSPEEDDEVDREEHSNATTKEDELTEEMHEVPGDEKKSATTLHAKVEDKDSDFRKKSLDLSFSDPPTHANEVIHQGKEGPVSFPTSLSTPQEDFISTDRPKLLEDESPTNKELQPHDQGKPLTPAPHHVECESKLMEKKALMAIQELPLTTVSKIYDPGKLSVSCSIKGVNFRVYLDDIGSDVNLMTKTIAEVIRVSRFQASKTLVHHEDRPSPNLFGFKPNLLPQVGDDFVPTVFHTKETKKNTNHLLFLGSSFAAPVRALIDKLNQQVRFSKVNEKTFYPATLTRSIHSTTLGSGSEPILDPGGSTKDVQNVLQEDPFSTLKESAKQRSLKRKEIPHDPGSIFPHMRRDGYLHEAKLKLRRSSRSPPKAELITPPNREEKGEQPKRKKLNDVFVLRDNDEYYQTLNRRCLKPTSAECREAKGATNPLVGVVPI